MRVTSYPTAYFLSLAPFARNERPLAGGHKRVREVGVLTDVQRRFEWVTRAFDNSQTTDL